MSFRISYSIAQRLFAMRRYGGGMLYAALPLHMQRGCFQIRTHDQQVTKAQLYRCTRARPHVVSDIIRKKKIVTRSRSNGHQFDCKPSWVNLGCSGSKAHSIELVTQPGPATWSRFDRSDWWSWSKS